VDQTYRIFTDGSAIGNPGPGGWGVVVIQGKERREMSGARPWTTISAMELVAAGPSASIGGRQSTDRAVLRLRIPDLWNACICLPLAASRLAKPARNRIAASRIVDGADRAEHKTAKRADRTRHRTLTRSYHWQLAPIQGPATVPCFATRARPLSMV